jgi:hypothetical protein
VLFLGEFHFVSDLCGKLSGDNFFRGDNFFWRVAWGWLGGCRKRRQEKRKRLPKSSLSVEVSNLFFLLYHLQSFKSSSVLSLSTKQIYYCVSF